MQLFFTKFATSNLDGLWSMQTTGHNAIIIYYTLFGFQPFNEPLSLRVGGTEPKFEICLMFKLNIYI